MSRSTLAPRRRRSRFLRAALFVLGVAGAAAIVLYFFWYLPRWGAGDQAAAPAAHGYAGQALEPLLPGGDFLAYFHRAPAVWDEATGRGVTVAADGPYLDSVRSIAPEATVVPAGLAQGPGLTERQARDAVGALAANGVRALAIYDPANYPSGVAMAIAEEARAQGMTLLVGLDPGTPSSAAGLLSDLDLAGAIIVGPLDWGGAVLLMEGQALTVTCYASTGGFVGDPTRDSLGVALGAAALKLQGLARTDPSDVKKAFAGLLPETWVNSELGTGQWIEPKFTVDPKAGAYINQSGYRFRWLDVPALLGRGADFEPSWPNDGLTGIARVRAEGRLTGRGMKVAIIDANFWPDCVSIRDRVMAAEAIGAPGLADLAGFHGTYMAQLVLRYAPEADLVLLGVGAASPGVTDPMKGTRRCLVQAIERAVELKVDVISMSWKAYVYDGAVRKALKRAAAAGVVVVANSCGVREDGVIVPQSLEASYYDILSREVYKTPLDDPDLWLGDIWVDYRLPVDLWSGTSNTSPQVAGMAALVLEAHPDFSPAEVEQRLVETATSLPGGKLFPNVEEAVK